MVKHTVPRLWACALTVLLLGFVAVPVHANTKSAEYRPLTSECLASVSQDFGIHVDVLLAILIVEGGTVGKNSRQNGNGTYDIGLFQINTIHLPTLKALGLTEAELRNDGCLSAVVAAWHLNRTLTPEVLARITDEESYLRALARYHSATPEHNERYANRLRGAFAYLYRNGQ